MAGGFEVGETRDGVSTNKRNTLMNYSGGTYRFLSSNTADVELARFKGRPGELSPKARFWLLAGWLFPSRFKYVSSFLLFF